jgi:hypothetical protein
MNKDQLIKVSNLIGLISIIALLYWVFIFVIITIFGLKIFRENLTESFYLSIIGILALMFGALMINIMFNMTKISEHISKSDDSKNIPKKRSISKWIFIISFPVLLGLMFLGDYISVHKKERVITQVANDLTKNYKDKIDKLLDYKFTIDYIKESNAIVDLLTKSDENIRNINIIVQDSIDGEIVYLEVGNIYLGNNGLKNKVEYILKSSKTEKIYLNEVFNKGKTKPRFDSHDGNYEFYYPVKSNNRIIILYYNEYQRYGKIGS